MQTGFVFTACSSAVPVAQAQRKQGRANVQIVNAGGILLEDLQAPAADPMIEVLFVTSAVA